MARTAWLSDRFAVVYGAFDTAGIGCLLPRQARTRLLLLAILGLVVLGGCGKRGDPAPPGPPEAVTWPRTFPPDPAAPATPSPERR